MSRPVKVLIGLIFLISSACGASQRLSAPKMEAMGISQAPLNNNHFKRDKTGQLTEEQLKEILESPAFLEEETRLGIVQVTTAYEADPDIPLNLVPSKLSDALENTGHFEVTTEVSSDWPTDGSIAGLRELAARYRSKYLLLYRHRFVERSRVNGWAWTYPTIIGALVAPGSTNEIAGVLEATMFDVRNGTVLFTVFERVHSEEMQNIWNPEHKARKMKTKMLSAATDRLSKRVRAKVGRLVAANPSKKNKAIAKVEPKKAPVVSSITSAKVSDETKAVLP